MPPHPSSCVRMWIKFPLPLGPQVSDSAPHVPALHFSGPPPLSLSPSHSETLAPAAVENLPLIPLFSLLYPPSLLPTGSCTHTSSQSLLAIVPPPRNYPGDHRRVGGGGWGGSCEIFLSFRRCSSAGQGALHLPWHGCGIMRKEREDGEGACCCCCCCCCLCLLQYERLFLAWHAFHLSRSLSRFCSLALSRRSPTLYPLSSSPCSVTVYLLLLQLFGFTIQCAAGCMA